MVTSVFTTSGGERISGRSSGGATRTAGSSGSGAEALRAYHSAPSLPHSDMHLRPGDGRTFPRNPKSDELLARLATELVKVDERRR